MPFDLNHYWYRDRINLLLPLSWLFGACVAFRRFCYRKGFLKSKRVDVPVIVVGNITVGGTGKTPFVMWLVRWLREQGYQPGIISRGYGAKVLHRMPHRVSVDESPDQVGDEALLLARETASPVVVCVDRVAAAQALLKQTNCNIIISDDGLQHYALSRDIEIVIVDGERRFGNGCLLPAGPLREPLSRLNEADVVVVNGGSSDELSMRLELINVMSLNNRADGSIRGKTVHAIAGIGNPDRFFQTLRRAGFDVIPHAFPDHHLYNPEDLNFNDNLPIVMTTKDAVKCEKFAKENYWCAVVTAVMDERIPELLTSLLQGKEK